MFAGSSRQMNRSNPDGSYNVYCYSCGEYISRTFVRAQRALCALCAAAEAGQELTLGAIQMYKAAKAEKIDAVSALAMPEPDLRAVGVKKWSLGSVAGEVLNALGNFALNRRPQPPAKNEDGRETSAQLAKAKRRPRLFSGVLLGSMQDVDKSLKEPDK